MDFIITMTSDSDYIALRHFSTLEELTEFVSKEGRIVMQPTKRMGEATFRIEIYDDYRE